MVFDPGGDNVPEPRVFALGSRNPGKSLVVAGFVGDQRYPIGIIIDTAAQITTIGLPLCERIGLDLSKAEPAFLRLAGEGHTISAKYLTGLPLHLGEHSFLLDVCAAPIKHDILLGLDFLAKYNCSIDMGRGELVVEGTGIIPMFYTERPNGRVS